MKRNIVGLTFFLLLLSFIYGGFLLKSQILIGGGNKKKVVPTSKATTMRENGDLKDRMNGIHFYFNGPIHSNCPIEAMVIDPLGRKLGFDPIKSKHYSEIPWSAYGGPVMGMTTSEKTTPLKETEIVSAVNGDYIVKIVGTGVGKYSISVGTHNTLRQHHGVGLVSDIPISLNMVHTYSVHYDSANLSATYISGGFDGGGQRPKDVNKFLTYANPSDSQTDVPAGITTFPLMIFYGSNIIAGTFKATLNGGDATSLFNPTPGNHETVNINLISGRNVLLLSTDGNLPSRVATDTDRLVFIVK